MARQFYAPLIVIAVLAVLVGIQLYFADETKPDAPELYQSQVAKAGNSLENILEFVLDIELQDDHEIKIRYMDTEEDKIATVRRTDKGSQQEQTDDEEQIASLLGSIPVLTSNQPLTLIKDVLDQLQIHENDLKEFEMKYELKDGTSGSLELEVDEAEEDTGESTEENREETETPT